MNEEKKISKKRKKMWRNKKAAPSATLTHVEMCWQRKRRRINIDKLHVLRVSKSNMEQVVFCWGLPTFSHSNRHTVHLSHFFARIFLIIFHWTNFEKRIFSRVKGTRDIFRVSQIGFQCRINLKMLRFTYSKVTKFLSLSWLAFIQSFRWS